MEKNEETFSINQATQDKDTQNIKDISKVIHCRNVSKEVTESDLVVLASKFGKVTNVLILRGKNQAFIQMEDENSAANLVQHYSVNQAKLRGKLVYFQYSNRDEITSSNNQKSILSYNDSQSPILFIKISNLQFQITVDILHQVFSKYGQILKIITYSKNNSFRSFVQFANIHQASSAKAELDNKNIYPKCCLLKIQFSPLPDLDVKYNNEKTRDYTNPNLPSGMYSDTYYHSNSHGLLHPPHLPLHPPRMNNFNSRNQINHNNNHHNNNNNNYNDNNNMMNRNQRNSNNINNNNSRQMNNNNSNHHNNGNNNNHYFKHNNNASILPYSGYVLIVSGINENTTPENLFTLFGVYGDVVRVKILYKKKDTALLQFSTPQQANTALLNLNGLSFHGKHLKVSYSKHQSISLPKTNEPNQENIEYTRDFTGSPLHRYKVAGSKNFQHITPPCCVLHLSNLPASVSEESLQELFSQNNRSVVAVKFFQKDKKMALVEFESIDDAVDALIELHDHKIDDQNIRVSFSKSIIPHNEKNSH